MAKSISSSMSEASARSISNSIGRAPIRLWRVSRVSRENTYRHEFSSYTGGRSWVRSSTAGS